MTALVVALQLVAAGCAAVSAWLWYKASLVQPTPYWFANPLSEPVDEQMKNLGWLSANLEASSKSGSLNKTAALWTALAAAFAAASTIASIFTA